MATRRARHTATLRFDPATHTYRLAGRPLISVTTVLKKAGLMDDLFWLATEEARVRGTRVHAATVAIDAGEAVAETALLPYATAYVRFLALYRTRWTAIEKPVASARLRVAGTPDRVGLFNGVPAIVDIKSGEEAAWHALQLAGYELLLPPLPFPRRRIGLYLRDDGTFRVRSFDDPGDAHTFLRALAQVSPERKV